LFEQKLRKGTLVEKTVETCWYLNDITFLTHWKWMGPRCREIEWVSQVLPDDISTLLLQGNDSDEEFYC